MAALVAAIHVFNRRGEGVDARTEVRARAKFSRDAPTSLSDVSVGSSP
jgi:hypothetical protein